MSEIANEQTVVRSLKFTAHDEHTLWLEQTVLAVNELLEKNGLSHVQFDWKTIPLTTPTAKGEDIFFAVRITTDAASGRDTVWQAADRVMDRYGHRVGLSHLMAGRDSSQARSHKLQSE